MRSKFGLGKMRGGAAATVEIIASALFLYVEIKCTAVMGYQLENVLRDAFREIGRSKKPNERPAHNKVSKPRKKKIFKCKRSVIDLSLQAEYI